MALGYVLTWVAGLGRRPATILLALAARLVLFVAVIAVLARSLGTTAGVVAMVAAIATRGYLVGRVARSDTMAP